VFTWALRGEFTASALSVASIMQFPFIESIAEQCSETNGEDAVRRAGDLTWLEDFSRKHRSSVEQVFREADVERVLPTLPSRTVFLCSPCSSKIFTSNTSCIVLRKDLIWIDWRTLGRRSLGDKRSFGISFLLS
jgi:hypothetical protein